MEKTSKIKLHQTVLSQLDARKIGLAYGEDIDRCRRRAEEIINEEMNNASVSHEYRDSLRRELIDEVFGYGPITPLLEDPSVSEIMVNGKDSIYLEREGKLTRHDKSFLSEESLRVAIDRMVARVNRRLDESSPYVDARLPDGSRINAIIPPVSLTGACLTIRKFRKEAFSLDELVRIGSLSTEASEYLREAVLQRKNIIVSGGTGSGKTTLLNALSGVIPEDDRIVTIEDSAELRLQKPHVIRLESRPPNIEGGGSVTIRDLVRNSLRMRPDRIIVGECRGGEALDMLQAMNTGHDGSLSTGHANSTHDMLSRLETMVLQGAAGLPLDAIRQQIASALDIIIHLSRLRDKSRKTVEIVEVLGYDQATRLISINPLYEFREDEKSTQKKVSGALVRTSNKMVNRDKLIGAGVDRVI